MGGTKDVGIGLEPGEGFSGGCTGSGVCQAGWRWEGGAISLLRDGEEGQKVSSSLPFLLFCQDWSRIEGAGDLVCSRKICLSGPIMTEGEYPIINSPYQLLANEGLFPLAHYVKSPSCSPRQEGAQCTPIRTEESGGDWDKVPGGQEKKEVPGMLLEGGGN